MTAQASRLKRQVNLMSLSINNAGLILLQIYIKPLFSRLELTENDVFVSDSAQHRAVHFLQFLVTGDTQTPEHYLTLNKLLCGIALDTPLELSIDISDAEKELCHGLLSAFIEQWSQVRNTSIDGIRSNWLVRDGSLAETKDHWDLTVARRAYDILLERSPYSFDVIKFPWMEKTIYVAWPT